jgi:hypothetical protein
LVKIQKDFIRDLIENGKNLVQDLDVATGNQTKKDFSKLEKCTTQEQVFEKFYALIYPRFEDHALELD